MRRVPSRIGSFASGCAMALRVIAGEYRGRVLRAVPGQGTRPLLGQVREAIFNILGAWVEGREVWDLFAGTGASGIEALSRGARRVLFVEKSNQALRVLRENLHGLGEGALVRTHVVRADAWDPPPMTPQGEAGEVPPELVFLDPPYAMVAEDPVRSVVRATRLARRMAPGGVLVFHFQEGHLDRDDFPGDVQVELRRWGASAVAFLEVPGATTSGVVDESRGA